MALRRFKYSNQTMVQIRLFKSQSFYEKLDDQTAFHNQTLNLKYE